MQVEFEVLKQRIGEDVIQTLLSDALPVINGISESAIRIQELKRALFLTYTPFDFLTNKKLLKKIIPLLTKEEAIDLATHLNIRFSNQVPWLSLEEISLTASRKRSLCEYFQVEFKDVVKDDIVNIINVVPQYPLFTHQLTVKNKVKKILWENGNEKVLIHMPTGSGKTRTCMNIVCDYLRANPKHSVIWFANTEELCQQASDEFTKAWEVLGNREMKVQNIWSGNSLDNSFESSFIVFGIQSFISLYSNNTNIATELSERIDLVIMDEAHMAIAPKYKLAIDILLFTKAKLIGLSATPGRSWNEVDKDLELSNYFGKNKVTLEIDGYENCVDYLIEKEYLAKVKNESLLFSDGIEPTEEDYKYLEDHLQLSKSFLNKLSIDASRNILIVSKVISLLNKHNRIIIFSINVDHAESLAIALSALGINAAAISSRTDQFSRRTLISEFKSPGSEPMVLCNYGVLTTGFDAPRTSCAIIARPTDSLVLYSQMVGRVIRGPKAGGNEVAEIITVVDTQLKGFRSVADAFLNWEDVW